MAFGQYVTSDFNPKIHSGVHLGCVLPEGNRAFLNAQLPPKGSDGARRYTFGPTVSLPPRAALLGRRLHPTHRVVETVPHGSSKEVAGFAVGLQLLEPATDRVGMQYESSGRIVS